VSFNVYNCDNTYFEIRIKSSFKEGLCKISFRDQELFDLKQMVQKHWYKILKFLFMFLLLFSFCQSKFTSDYSLFALGLTDIFYILYYLGVFP
jgi:hypothetical protein